MKNLELISEELGVGFGLTKRGFWKPYKLYVVDSSNDRIEVGTFSSYRSAQRFFDLLAHITLKQDTIEWYRLREDLDE